MIIRCTQCYKRKMAATATRCPKCNAEYTKEEIQRMIERASKETKVVLVILLFGVGFIWTYILF